MLSIENQQRVPLGTLVSFSVGSLASGVYSTAPGILLLYFMTQTLRLPVALAPFAILIPKIVIIGFDPIVGAWSDRFRSRWGPRRPFILIGGLLSAITFVALFSAPILTTTSATFAVVTLLYLLAAMSYSLFAVPYIALPAEMSTIASERARIIGWRMTFVFAGVLLGATLPPVLLESLGGGPTAYREMALIVAALCLVSTLVPALLLPTTSRGAIAAAPFGATMREVVEDRRFVAAAAFYLVAIIATGVSSSAAPYFTVFALGGRESDVSQLMGTQLVAALLSMTAWSKLVARAGIHKCLALSLAAQLAGSLLLQIGITFGPTTVIVACLIAGLGVGGLQVGAFSLLADVTASHPHPDRGGMLTGLWTAAEKVGLAVGPLVCGWVLAAGGFREGTPRALLEPSALTAAGFAMTIAPAFFLAAGLLILRRQRNHIGCLTT